MKASELVKKMADNIVLPGDLHSRAEKSKNISLYGGSGHCFSSADRAIAKAIQDALDGAAEALRMAGM